MKQKNTSDIISSSSNALTAADGVISSIFKAHMLKFERADKYLEAAILEKGAASDKDVEIAAHLYGIPMLRKKYKNIAKMLNKADALCKSRIQETGEPPADVDDDWLMYFMDRASNISETSVQSIFACILTQECCERGSMRKVMIDRLALLDKKSAHLFATLCRLTYDVTVDNKRTYSIPLYLRDDILLELVRNKAVDFTEKQAIEYQRLLTLDGLGADSQLAELESELDILHEIGLINLSESGDEGDVYSAKNSIFCFRVGTKDVGSLSLYDKELKISFVCTGNSTYTKMGLDLYNSLTDIYPPCSELRPLLKAYIQLQRNR